jgi:hypothetical protein
LQRIVTARTCRLFFTAVLLVGISMGATGCTGGLAFRENKALTITVPAENELVSEPLIVEWTMDPKPADLGGFAVFLDRFPMPPGKSIESFKLDNRLNIFTTDSPDGMTVQIDALEGRSGVAKALRDRHELTVVPLDRLGKRIGEHAKRVEFDVFREDSQ